MSSVPLNDLSVIPLDRVLVVAVCQGDGRLTCVGDRTLIDKLDPLPDTVECVVLAQEQQPSNLRLNGAHLVRAGSIADAVRQLARYFGPRRYGFRSDHQISLTSSAAQARRYHPMPQLMKRIKAFVSSRNSGYVVLAAGPVFGKTAFVQHWRSQPETCAHETGLQFTACAFAERVGDATIRRLMLHLEFASRLSLGLELEQQADNNEEGLLADQELFALRMRKWLQVLSTAPALGEPAHTKRVLLLDGLDEFEPTSPGVLHMPSGLPAKLPPGVFVLFTTRPGLQLHWPDAGSPSQDDCLWLNVDEMQGFGSDAVSGSVKQAIEAWRAIDRPTADGVEDLQARITDQAQGHVAYVQEAVHPLAADDERKAQQLAIQAWAGGQSTLPIGPKAAMADRLARLWKATATEDACRQWLRLGALVALLQTDDLHQRDLVALVADPDPAYGNACDAWRRLRPFLVGDAQAQDDRTTVLRFSHAVWAELFLAAWGRLSCKGWACSARLDSRELALALVAGERSEEAERKLQGDLGRTPEPSAPHALQHYAARFRPWHALLSGDPALQRGAIAALLGSHAIRAWAGFDPHDVRLASLYQLAARVATTLGLPGDPGVALRAVHRALQRWGRWLADGTMDAVTLLRAVGVQADGDSAPGLLHLSAPGKPLEPEQQWHEVEAMLLSGCRRWLVLQRAGGLFSVHAVDSSGTPSHEPTASWTLPGRCRALACTHAWGGALLAGCWDAGHGPRLHLVHVLHGQAQVLEHPWPVDWPATASVAHLVLAAAHDGSSEQVLCAVVPQHKGQLWACVWQRPPAALDAPASAVAAHLHWKPLHASTSMIVALKGQSLEGHSLKGHTWQLVLVDLQRQWRELHFGWADVGPVGLHEHHGTLIGDCTALGLRQQGEWLVALQGGHWMRKLPGADSVSHWGRPNAGNEMAQIEPWAGKGWLALDAVRNVWALAGDEASAASRVTTGVAALAVGAGDRLVWLDAHRRARCATLAGLRQLEAPQASLAPDLASAIVSAASMKVTAYEGLARGHLGARDVDLDDLEVAAVVCLPTSSCKPGAPCGVIGGKSGALVRLQRSGARVQMARVAGRVAALGVSAGNPWLWIGSRKPAMGVGHLYRCCPSDGSDLQPVLSGPDVTALLPLGSDHCLWGDASGRWGWASSRDEAARPDSRALCPPPSARRAGQDIRFIAALPGPSGWQHNRVATLDGASRLCLWQPRAGSACITHPWLRLLEIELPVRPARGLALADDPSGGGLLAWVLGRDEIVCVRLPLQDARIAGLATWHLAPLPMSAGQALAFGVSATTRACVLCQGPSGSDCPEWVDVELRAGPSPSGVQHS